MRKRKKVALTKNDAVIIRAVLIKAEKGGFSSDSVDKIWEDATKISPRNELKRREQR